MSLSRIFFALVILSTFATLLHRYLWTRLVRDVGLPEPWGRVATIVIIGLAVMSVLLMPIVRLLPREVARPIAVVGYTWMGLSFLLLVFVLFGDLVRLLLHGVRLVRPDVAGSGASAMVYDPHRRLVVARGLALIAAVGATLTAGFGLVEALAPIAVRKVRVALAKLPASMNGMTIAQLSDVHVGSTIGHDFIETIVAETNALHADVIVITGDLVDGSVDELRTHVAPLGKLKARHGVFFVTGNHEYYSGADAWIAELTRLGIRVLRNERVELRGGDAPGDVIDLVGIDDASAHQFGHGHGADLARAVLGRNRDRVAVLLAHQPKQIDEAIDHGIALQLSGHTHGGQIWPFNFMVRLQQPFVAGLHRRGDTQIYVSRGTGYWGPPMRVGAPPEITEITLARA